MEAYFYILLLGIIPVFSLLACKQVWPGYFIACQLGCPVMVLRSISMEPCVPGYDFDLAFLFSIVISSALLCVAYLPYAVVVRYLKTLRHKKDQVKFQRLSCHMPPTRSVGRRPV